MTKTVTKLMNDDVTTLFVTDGEGNILLANEFTAMTLGMPLNTLLNSNVYDLVASNIYNASATIETLKTHKMSEVNLTTKAGYQIKSKSTPIFYPDKTLHLVVTKSDPLTIEELERWTKNIAETSKETEEFSELEVNEKVIAESNEMKRVLRVCKQVSKYNSRILLLGESGVGKEVVANYIHQHSQLAGCQFITVNCAAIPDNLFESEFFGYKKGTFTGAKEDKIGLIEAADGGTLFLDEISEMPLEMQTKLLRALETMKIRKVGDIAEIPISFRLISASNQDILSLVEKGKFRRDLYYRINAIPVVIPPLRERKKDVLALANYFIDYFNEQHQRSISLETQHIKHLMLSEWSGNVRELKNYIEYLVVTADLDLPVHQGGYETPSNDQIEESLQAIAGECDYQAFIQYVEKIYFQKKLESSEWNISQTAEESQVSRPFIYKKINELELKQNVTS
ncbi:sigma 54-interacting transcriptional regulator [Carnobacterium maltaromaticum]|uniref:sigma-54 interaction domain-containing protein n=1 Tax=Carnobacterium maltaromaticum TaxID=2751 RepID=UPI00298A50A5|nr:sigma 54-interacting transcriptional regulator [Carnobacterium maltaromaticum]MDW5523391.1 sigma 54-interacting transcriptional regulator [Carnobacterium maltaromaticum]